MQIPILNGIYTDESADFKTSYPVNLAPVVIDSGISKGYLRPVEGLVQNGTMSGTSRGGINWNGVCYRVVGSTLYKVLDDGTTISVGSVGAGGHCSFDYDFDRLAISSGGSLYYYDGTTLSLVVDVDLGTCLDVVWIDGYFISTDGEFIVSSDLGAPTSFNPLKYGSSEIDPDPINSVMKLRNEIVAVNRNTIEFFRNAGGSGFPFERINGAQVNRGSVGTFASCIFNETVTFIGSGRNESIGIYMAVKAQSQKISTRDIDYILAQYSSSELSSVIVESRQAPGRNHLWVRLPDRTLVYDHGATQIAGIPVWFVLTAGVSGFSVYPGGDLVFCYDKWLLANPSGGEIGYLSDEVSSQWGDEVMWEFGTAIVYNEGRGALFHSIELVCLTGRVAVGTNPTISTSYSTDGETWSTPKYISVGTTGNRNKRLVWFGCGHMRNWRAQRFQGTSQAFLSIARLEAQLEPLAV